MRGLTPGWRSHARCAAMLLTCLCLFSFALYAQDKGEQGIEEATTLVKKYFDKGTILLYALGGFLGLYGAVKVYSKWSAGDQETQRYAAAWFGGCIFLVLVVTVLRKFFGL